MLLEPRKSIVHILTAYFNSKWLIFLSSESIIVAWFTTGPLKTKNVVNNDRVWFTVVIYCDDNFKNLNYQRDNRNPKK